MKLTPKKRFKRHMKQVALLNQTQNVACVLLLVMYDSSDVSEDA